ncbi:DSD1 family PLP-dependent enzyme [Solimonas sp. K1W22B-7]|uniref:DSD1 family PLP-dependent enzyme n=1 Tax=Solimonas sp. K1W22B-7 TaxID=2303331 RepID=UPI000E335710|nr:DSD1 family PLP-dependent enzyme [Solimonas sp. K1W22B-7]AXQ29810.1 DSD1 family PLP-dependent enzyme [Solimonas sp. K1W22B-7]
MKRRNFLLGAAALGAGAAWWARPGAEGAPYDDYFRALNQELKRNGNWRPSLVIDLDRLDHNIAQVVKSVRAPKHYRVVEKSLPSAKLLDYIMRKAGTKRLMSFHQPFANDDALLFPDADILIGKPLPVRSAGLFYQNLKGSFDPSRQMQWLLDTPERLQQYLELAQGLGTKLRINIEIDVGLHRGGVDSDQTLAQMLKLIEAHPQQLEFAGFMGYDPHVTALPRLAGTREELFGKVMQTYQQRVDLLRSQFPKLWREDLTLNTAGSPTYRLHEQESLSNDISVGTAMLKPTHYDIDTLAEHVPAAFIATPVLKAEGPLRLPGLDGLSRMMNGWDPNLRETFFIYGGNWMAEYESPRGLRRNELYGHSSNQENVTASIDTGLKVDDHVFLRPVQVEGVLLEFGDLIALRGGRIVDRWPVLSQAAG